jgi:pimeloyl-ACP methyl ester carboxylesterase
MGVHGFQTNARMRKMVKRSGVVCAALIMVMASSVISSRWILSRAAQARIGNPPGDLNAQPIRFQSDSRATIHGWWCPAQSSRGAILLLPGIRANRLSMVDRARFLHRAGYSTLLIDFQATGESKGDHITFGWKESRDVIAAVSFIHHVDPTDRIGIIGSSLGGAAALLASPPLKVNSIVLEAVYPAIEIATRNRMENYFGPIGRILPPPLLWQLQPRLGISADALRPLDHAPKVGCPVFILSGERDRNTRPDDTRMLFSSAQHPKQLWLVPNAGHVDLRRAVPAEYESRVLAFLERM